MYDWSKYVWLDIWFQTVLEQETQVTNHHPRDQIQQLIQTAIFIISPKIIWNFILMIKNAGLKSDFSLIL